MFQDLLYKLYGKIDFNDVITCWVNKSKRKADIYIKINNYVRGISIKKGIKNSVHVESVKEFVSFLKHMKVNDELINKFLKYNHVDGTTNGTGNKSEYEVDAIIYGVVDDFIWITNEEIKYIIKKHLSDSISSLHISCLSIQPMARNLNYSPKYEFARNYIQVKWYNLADQIIEVMATYRNGRAKASKLITK